MSTVQQLELPRRLRGFGAALLLMIAHMALGQNAGLTASAEVEPNGPHPRLFADAETLAGFKARASTSGSYIANTLKHCDEVIAAPQTFAADTYMGFDWAQSLQSCLVAWRATGRDAYARAAMVYFKALLDDLKTVGDGQGGDQSARRDSGYAIRMLGPYTALAYDWLHDYPAMTEALRAHARQRFKAWTDWYLASGYRARSPGSNYNAAYVYAATLIAIAQGGEAGADGEQLWRLVTGTLLQKDLLPAIDHGLLRGGDWSEGWQYAPLSVASYALALRAIQPYGVDVSAVPGWSRAVLLRHIYALTPDGTSTYAGGDAEAETPNLSLRRDTLAGIIAGLATTEVKGWAQAELNRLPGGGDPSSIVFVSALADAARIAPVPFARDAAAHGYYAAGTSTLYWRSSWKSGALWFASPCAFAPDTDHWHPDAGNFVLSRGNDDLIVDPSPYGTQSTLTSNAPTMESTVVPPDYVPSQAYWGHRTGFRWATQSSGGELLARCDYTDQYRLQEHDTDMNYALRDFMLLPYAEANGTESAALLIIDRTQRRDGKGALSLRFRTGATLKSVGNDAVQATSGRSLLRIAPLFHTGDDHPAPRAATKGDCYKGNPHNCEAARFAVTELSLRVTGAAPAAVTLLDAAAARVELSPATAVQTDGAQLWTISRGRSQWIIGSYRDSAAVQFDVPAGRVLLVPDSANGAARVAVQAVAAGTMCHVSLRPLAAGANPDPGAALPGRPLMFDLSAACVPQPLASSDFLTTSN